VRCAASSPAGVFARAPGCTRSSTDLPMSWLTDCKNPVVGGRSRWRHRLLRRRRHLRAIARAAQAEQAPKQQPQQQTQGFPAARLICTLFVEHDLFRKPASTRVML